MQEKIDIMTFAVAGVQYRPANVIDPLVDGMEIRFVAEPENAYDKFAIKIEAFEEDMDEQGSKGIWNHIGYVPKKNTWIFHLLRQANIKIDLSLLVNHNATDKDKLLVSTSFTGNKEAAFI